MAIKNLIGDVLKPEYEDMYDEFIDIYGWEEGNCSCHINPPCSSCIHEGNINNLYECDEAWEHPLIHAVRESVETRRKINVSGKDNS